MKFILLVLLVVACSQVGSQGPKGDAGTVILVQAFCPNLGGGIGFQEQYLIIDNKAYAVYYDGTRTFLAYLKPGNYVTTDGRSCNFTVNTDGTVSY